MNTVIIKYPGGNVQSVTFALQRLGLSPVISDQHEVIQAADRVIFPGVGEAATAMRHLRERRLDELIPRLRQPVLGICLGMQLMCRHSEERDTPGLSIFDTEVVRFTGKSIKVPHMGWNQLYNTKDWLKTGIEGIFAYFVHSYFVPLNSNTVAQTTYDLPFSAALRKQNFFAVQFHPEKSGEAGGQILQRFLQQEFQP
ncbi:MAG: imidazole glycerol phosphate synthase subunit HisH [Cyclobacteriaceae bacterium]|nr:imidazole glycerol phosphate synthase subunit HisH [Cyclobacteriaceae bacterium]